MSLLTLAALGLPGMAMLAHAPIPAPVTGPWLLAFAVAGSAIVGAATHLAVRAQGRLRQRQARLDLYRFLRLCYAHRCERFEDQLRVTALGPLRRWVQRARHELEGVEARLDAVSHLIADVRRLAEAALFDTPAGRCDVLVAEGGPLTRARTGTGGMTLEHVLRATRQRAGAASQLSAMSEMFLAGPDAFLAVEDEELASRLLAFAHEHVDAAVAAEMAADLHAAVCDPAVQGRVAQLVESPLHIQRGTMQPLERYVCGRPPTSDLTGLPPGQLVIGRQTDWWLMAALFAGGDAPALGDELVDRLFPSASGLTVSA